MSDFASQAAESPSGSDDIRTSLLKQTTERIHKGKESRGWIGKAEWSICIEGNSDVDRRSPSIFRVPNDLKKESKAGEAYIPKRVSLGPYHHRSAELPPMNSHKGRALHRMMTRANDSETMDISFPDRAVEEIALLEQEIRESYEEKIDCNGETLGLMLSLDGCFILEILRTLRGDILHHELFSWMTNGDYYEPLFQVKKINYTGFDILNDILKLENQIPLVVLRKLLELELKSADDVENELWKVLCPSFLCVMYPFNYRKDFKQWSWSLRDEQEVHHLLGLLRTLIVSPPFQTGERALDVGIRPYMGACLGCGDEGHSVLQNEDEEEEAEESMNGVGSILRAVELIRAGVKFKPCAGGIKAIHFDTKSDTIYLPPIEVADSTEILFRNLIAYEMCKPFELNYVACYVCLMDQLIDSEEDVALLRKYGIVTNGLGSDAEVAKLFNGLCTGVTVSLEGVFDKLTGKVKLYHKNKFKVYCAELASEYCSSPWKILGLVAATVLLLLTVVQTIFVILSVYK